MNSSAQVENTRIHEVDRGYLGTVLVGIPSGSLIYRSYNGHKALCPLSLRLNEGILWVNSGHTGILWVNSGHYALHSISIPIEL